MTLLPIVERELRVASRRWTTFLLRLLAAVTFVLIGMGGIITVSNLASGASSGIGLFRTLSGLCFIVCVVAGPILAADILSAEKRQGTLGLLFLTDLRPIDVVLGKLAAVSINAAAAVLASVPVFAIAFMLGGITLPILIAVALALFNALAFSLVVTVIVSACCTEGRSSLALSAFLVGCAVLLLPQLHGLALPWQQLSPVMLMERATFHGPGFNPLEDLVFLRSLATSQALLWLSLFLAGSMLKRAWRGEGRAGGNGNLWQRMARWMFGGSVTRQRLRARLLDRNPWTWLVSRNVLKRRLFIWGTTPVMPLFAVFGRTMFGSYGHDLSLTLVLAYAMQLLLKVLIASESSHLFAENRRAGSFELLLTTPLREQDIVKGHAASVRRLFALPVVVTLAVTMFLAVPELEGWELVALIVIAGLFVWDMHALIWVGMWRGLVQKRSHLAAFSAMMRVLVLPSLAMLFFLPMIAVAPLALIFFILLIYGVGNGMQAAVASDILKGDLRAYVAQQFQSDRSET